MAEGLSVPDPDYIRFLLNPDQEYDGYFIVGNPRLAPVEKIGVVRKMLAAHSEVFRSQLQDSKLKAIEPEHITDIFPETFKNLLRFVYGHDTTDMMMFDDADNLLYAADRYIMPRLKNKLATRLMSLLNHTNICSLLNNPACYTVLELKSGITKILQFETNKVLASPQFLYTCADAFVKILESEQMNVPELDVWRAAVKWAKHKAGVEDGNILREQLEAPLRHIRVCALPYQDFCKEVAPTGILSKEEVAEVCVAHGTGEKPRRLTRVCNEMKPRHRPVSDRGSSRCENYRNASSPANMSPTEQGRYKHVGSMHGLSFPVPAASHQLLPNMTQFDPIGQTELERMVMRLRYNERQANLTFLEIMNRKTA